ncbi:MAG: response regulator transcription factor [Planctomycetota bacterium]
MNNEAVKILIIEDEKAIAAGLEFNFQEDGFETLIEGDGPSALKAYENNGPWSLVVLDLMLPGMSGYEICKEIRSRNASVPIMVLSAKATGQDKAHAFDCGANQYVTKPFELLEVLSRVRNLIKSYQAQPRAEDTPDSRKRFEFDDIIVDVDQFQVEVSGEVSTLTKMEMQLLKYFLLNEGKVLSRAQIMENVWDQSSDLSTRSIDNFVMRLRRILEPESSSSSYILSVRGTGYRFVKNSAETL